MDIIRSIRSSVEIGGVDFPITYYENGMILMDYPEQEPRVDNEKAKEVFDTLKRLKEKK